MLGILSEYSGLYLQLLAAGSIALLGLPLLFVPLAWARVLRWPIPGEARLAVYLGRCLGAVILVLAVFAFIAASDPALQPFFFQLVAANMALMVAIHAWGAIRRTQPMSETIETFAWATLLVLAGLTYPG